MSLNSWLSRMKPLPAGIRLISRLALQVFLWGAGLTVVSAILIAVVLQVPQGMNVRLWLDSARFPLLAWRIMLYAILAGTWFCGLRQSLMAQIRSRSDGRSLSSLRRLEVMAIALIALSEYNVWLAPR
ncbi:hypothetical protein C9F67_003582 [Salmonella enterica subsp. enterica serovar Oranienburg]|uniref:hypothetical protein n=1 Tax=Salmonella enterica TaxID=28901 RepID=UPI0008FD2D1D|nr:hypothetical protein [Salmonella enterica]EAA8931070.1 hypothetical protein [Salmonella enterica subsp. enterica serovar Gaminara]EAA9480894.1 hypothetical protein [Salmonella enterica subsp. enterica]EAS6829364.1 hypothetical protein [Salmonella enterica subsp. enterica serovar Give]ECE0527411.1 hypothetical protein [Salmonella enterica subsp. salamae]EEB1575923.1 hypothetical protein [Salmonella enterica subsp. enterica serovar Enteritidis]EEE3899035.1 hypothetical protein [Salmonella en